MRWSRPPLKFICKLQKNFITLHPSGNSGWVQGTFLVWKPAIFRKVKEIKHLSGGVALYAAQTNAQIDAEIEEKGGFRTETN